VVVTSVTDSIRPGTTVGGAPGARRGTACLVLDTVLCFPLYSVSLEPPWEWLPSSAGSAGEDSHGLQGEPRAGGEAL